MVLVVIWCAFFGERGLDHGALPWFGSDLTGLVGTVMFNYTFVTSIPSWVNEKKPRVSVNKSIWSTTIVGTILFVIVGVFGALSIDFTNSSGDLLKVISKMHRKNSVLVS